MTYWRAHWDEVVKMLLPGKNYDASGGCVQSSSAPVGDGKSGTLTEKAKFSPPGRASLRKLGQILASFASFLSLGGRGEIRRKFLQYK